MKNKQPKQLKAGDIVFGIKGKKLVYRIVIDFVTYPRALGTYCDEKFIFEKKVYDSGRIFAAHPTRHIGVDFDIETPFYTQRWNTQRKSTIPPKKTQQQHWFDQLLEDVDKETTYADNDEKQKLRRRLDHIHTLISIANEKDLAR